MSQQSELLRRLRQLPGERRDALLARLEDVSAGARSAPLSYRQEQLWLFDRFAPSSLAYGLGFAFPIEGRLAPEALRAALTDLLQRYTVLRSTFPDEDTRGTQQVKSVPEVRLEVEDVPDGQLRSRADEVVQGELRRGLDLNSGPMVRFRLLRATPEQHLLVLTSHYIVLDPRSARVLQSDLTHAYRARIGGEAPKWVREPVDFGAYASWQRDWCEQDGAREATEYWRGALAGWEGTELPTDSPRPRLIDLSSDMVRLPLPLELAAAADDLAKDDAERQDVLLAAFLILIARHTARGDLTVGLPYDVTGPYDADRLVGDIGNLLPLRVELDEADSFAAVVARVRDARRDGKEHSTLPFKLILDALGVEPDAGRLPLVQIGFTTTGENTGPVEADGVRIGCEQVDAGAGTFELALEVGDGEQPTVAVRFATSLYRRSTAARLLDRFLQTLGALCEQPDRPWGDAPLGTAQERADVLERWNAPIGAPLDTPLHELFAEVVAAAPDNTALVWQDGTLTYGGLDAWSRRIAARLVAAGVGLGDLVPVVMERGPALLAAVLGVLRAGGAYVPVDVGQPDERLAMILEDTGARTVVVSPGTADRVPQPLRVVLGPDPQDGPPAGEQHAPVVVPPASAAYVIYTSGSTGRPKGVVVEHRNAANFTRTVREMFDLTPEDRVLHFASPGFDVSVFEIFGTLLSGAVLYVMDEDQRRSVDALDAVLREQRITVIDLPPAIMELLAPEGYPDLRVAFVGGEAFTGELTTRWARGRGFWNGYGPTETTVTVVAKRCEGEWTSSPPIGRAMANHRAYVVDGAGSGVLPPGAVGELAIAGLGVARGYLGRPDLTADRFRPDPDGPPGSRRYLTGDLAVWDEAGDLCFVGRADRQVKVRGVRIELGEVEAALQAVDGVAQAVAEVAADPRTGALLMAYVVPERPGELQLDTIRSAVAGRLPSAMVPSVLVPLEAVPLTPSGKIDRRRLPAVEFAAVDELSDVDEENSTPTERTMRKEVFAPLLGARVGNHVNFFAAGGTSLQAIQLSSRVNAVFGVALPIADFFATPTVAGLSALVDAASTGQGAQRDALAEALELVEGRSDDEIAELAAELDEEGAR
ncbi:amino acid adenylation domain-containing protein [Streptomyces sp. ISL-99]|uniref:non-ribosomal peptide synthetase n=1 Tax=Streptomyces sp. ISL-99 TaxID=2819193 RepID=UPI001BE68043|nr:non-ribosomal peptide synthetase [Streptomyces sp. ISL-99]MBT2526246.1 amino acid adenylation domain-containing protein [Streptomyces sp. ISL-99]